MKVRFLLSLAVAAMLPSAAGAYEIGDRVALTSQLYGKVMSKNGTNHTVEVYANPDDQPSGALEIKNTYVVGGETFTATMIASGGFERCDLTNVTVGADMYLVGSRAFSGCTSLKAFFETERGSVTVIGDEAFDFTFALARARFPGVERVGQFAFRRSGIESVEMPEVKELGAGAFQECQNLTTFEGGEKLVSIGNIAFCNCPKFTGLTLGPSLTAVGATAFAFDVELKDMVIPAGQTEAGSSAYQGCGLTRVFILSDKVMDFLDASKLLQHKSLENIYCVGGVLEAVQEFLAQGSADSPVDMLAEVAATSIDEVLRLRPIDAEHHYQAVAGVDGISHFHVYDTVTGDEIQPEDGIYTLTCDFVRLSYRVDSVNLLDYVAPVDKSMIVAVDELPAEVPVAGRYFTLSGVEVSEPAEGEICICVYSDGTARKLRF